MLALAKANFFHHQGHLTPVMEAELSGMLESLTSGGCPEFIGGKRLPA